MGNLRDGIQSSSPKGKSSEGPPSFKTASKPLDAKGNESYVKDTLNILLNPSNATKDTSGVVAADKVNWRAGVGKGAEYVASGMYGAFVEVPPERLAKGMEGKFPGGVGIKYGKVEQEEVDLLKRIGESGAGPRLIAAKIDEPSGRGMVAMERIPGKTLRNLLDEKNTKVEDLEDGYIRGIAKLHRAGVAHGDAHLGNAIMQPNGQVRFVDFGYARFDPVRALKEALESASQSSSPVWALDVFSGPMATKMRDNLRRYSDEFKNYRSGLRTKEENDKLATDLIEKLYEGI